MTGLVLESVSVGGLHDVSLEVPGGQVVCLSGVSGTGKSRLLRAVADLEPHGGSISLNGAGQRDMPKVQALHEKYSDNPDFVILAMNVRDDNKEMAEYWAEKKYTFPT
ncbi:hypothetical protein LCGC14_1055220, partial [marine sediment metagenome]